MFVMPHCSLREREREREREKCLELKENENTETPESFFFMGRVELNLGILFLG